MTLRVKTFLACEVCGKEFGGPDAGDYPNWNPEELHAMLLAEARELFWIQITCGAAEVLVCSRLCAKKWVYNREECYANDR